MIIVSACLAGKACRYDGAACLDARIARLVTEKRAISACPEILGGLKTPREPCEIKGGGGSEVLDGKAVVITESGREVTDAFVMGAELFVRLAKRAGCNGAILKEKSPSCGTGLIYDGTFSGKITSGDGITAAAVRRAGIEIIQRSVFND